MGKLKDEIVFQLLGCLIDATCKEDASYNDAIEQVVEIVKSFDIPCVINWVAANKLPDYDGDYLCYVHQKQECGTVWEYQKVVNNEFTKWITEGGEIVVAWAKLPKPPCL